MYLFAGDDSLNNGSNGKILKTDMQERAVQQGILFVKIEQ